MSKGVKRWMAVSDIHGDKQDPKAVAVALDFARHFKPDYRILAGDVFDFACLRRGASPEESQKRLKPDVELGLEFIRKFKPTTFLRGNHDHRLWRAAEKTDGKLVDLADYLICDINDALGTACVSLPYHKRRGVHKMGRLRLLHGYHHGMNAVRDMARIYGDSAMGHIHAVDIATVPNIEGPRVGRSMGCLCLLDQDYNEAMPNTLRQSHGFAYGLAFPNGDYVYWQAAPQCGRWYLPSEVREWDAKAN